MSSKSRLKRNARETLQFRIGSTLIITHRDYMLEILPMWRKTQNSQSIIFFPSSYRFYCLLKSFIKSLQKRGLQIMFVRTSLSCHTYRGCFTAMSGRFLNVEGRKGVSGGQRVMLSAITNPSTEPTNCGLPSHQVGRERRRVDVLSAQPPRVRLEARKTAKLTPLQ